MPVRQLSKPSRPASASRSTATTASIVRDATTGRPAAALSADAGTEPLSAAERDGSAATVRLPSFLINLSGDVRLDTATRPADACPGNEDLKGVAPVFAGYGFSDQDMRR